MITSAMITSIITAIVSVVILTLTAWLLPLHRVGSKTLVNSSTKVDGSASMIESSRSFDWIEDSWIGEHWLVFNMIAAASSVIMAIIVGISPFAEALAAEDPRLLVLLIITATVWGFHLVWSTALDWRFHKIPRWPSVVHMVLMMIASIGLTAGTRLLGWSVAAIIIVCIMGWLLGTVPGSGMADGRLYAMIAAGAVPLLSTSAFWPALAAGILAIMNAIIVAVGPGSRAVRTDRSTSVFRRIMKTGSPMGPFVMISFSTYLVLLSYGVVTSSTALMLGL